jgi:photosystem II stability/assembly factor-like uncharacterized protein
LPTRIVVSVGTRKGVFLFTSDANRTHWERSGPFLAGHDISHATIDARTGRLYATDNDPWFGARIAISPDLGMTWHDSPQTPHFAEDSPLGTVAKLWHIEPGAPVEPNTLYCGVDPATVFRSDDGGETWQEVTALSEHPTRAQWFPGNGGLMAHSIVVDPLTPGRLWIAISAAGVFRSDDGGASWQPRNSGIRSEIAQFDTNLPTHPEISQCVHHLVAAAAPERLYAQSHLGTYRSDDAGDHWQEITTGLPSEFGMAIAAHPHDPDTAYVVPMAGGEFRVPPEARLRVYRTRDAGASWQPLSDGLPQHDAYMGIYREGLATDTLATAGIYLGTNTGHLYMSADEGDHWHALTTDLAPITSVSATVLE